MVEKSGSITFSMSSYYFYHLTNVEISRPIRDLPAFSALFAINILSRWDIKNKNTVKLQRNPVGMKYLYPNATTHKFKSQRDEMGILKC